MNATAEKLIQAIESPCFKPRSVGNLTVTSPAPRIREVRLHGNHIATLDSGDASLRFTLAGWNTPTTRRYVTALLQEFVHANARVHTVSGEAHYFGPTDGFADKRISSTEWVTA